ncbi:MAG: hypothetical protein NT167_20290, partial [Verrucomicrobia bacterium]|nr:hypothetical protein [Verrucomicrobiota bacterium]
MRISAPSLTVLACLLLLSVGKAVGAQATPAAATNTALKATAPGFAGSRSCQECHGKFYQLWQTSFHGLAMQPYTSELAQTKLTPQKEEVIAGKYS